MKTKLVLGLILLFGFILRFINIGNVPLGLQTDEASFLINSAAILETGRDEDSRLLPVLLQSTIDPKPALYSYLQVPFVAMFGPTIAASRLPSVFLGVISIYLAFLLVQKITENKKLSLLTAGLLAISPWHIIISRSTQEVILSFVFILISLLTAFSLKAWFLDKNNFSIKSIPYIKLVGLFLFSGLAMYAYHSSKILLIVFFTGSLGILLIQNFNKNRLAKTTVVLFVILSAFLVTALSALTRFNAIGLLSSDLPKAQIFEFTTLSTGATPLLLLRAFYNKIIFYFLFFLDQYFQHFSPVYFFTRGGSTDRLRVPVHGFFYLIESVLMMLGLSHLLSDKRFKNIKPFWLLFLLASPVAAALTTEGIPSSNRPFPMILPLVFLIVLGIDWLLKNRRSMLARILIIVTALGYLWGFAFFIQQYFVVSPLWHPWHRNDDFDLTAKRISEIDSNYERVVFTNDLREMYIYLWKYGMISISELQAQPMARHKESYQIGKYHFNQNNCDFSPVDLNTIVVTASDCNNALEEGFVLMEKTFFRDGTAAFRIYTPDPAAEVWMKEEF